MCSSLTNMVSLKVSFIFLNCMVCNRRWRNLLRIVGSSNVIRSRGRQGEKPCVSYLRRSELSAHVGQHKSYNLIAKGMVKEFGWRRGRKVCGALRKAVAVFSHRMCIDWCNSLSQPLKCNSLSPHKDPELAKLKAKSHVGVR